MSDLANPARPLRAVVLSGGGARGAYEAGVLAYIFTKLPEKLRRRGRFRIFCGTSVGAVHAAYLASTAHAEQYNIAGLLRIWRGLKIHEALRLDAPDLLRLPLEIGALLMNKPMQHGLILNSARLQQFVVRNVRWERIRRNIAAGEVEALTVSATHIASGHTAVFVDRRGGAPLNWSRDSRVVAHTGAIGALHVLASAATPFLFPPIAIDGRWYCDGGLRQNTPLSAPLRLQADRVLIVHAGYENTAAENTATETFPPPSVLLGKVLNALLLDRLPYDLARMEGYNELLSGGAAAFGPGFIDKLNQTSERVRGAKYRPVETLMIRPSRDIGKLATDFLETHRKELGRGLNWFLGKIANRDRRGDSDLLSYLLFDGRFAERLIQLGMADAEAARDKLAAFFDGD